VEKRALDEMLSRAKVVKLLMDRRMEICVGKNKNKIEEKRKKALREREKERGRKEEGRKKRMKEQKR
jgi:hypothetical protein